VEYLYEDFAAAYVRGSLAEAAGNRSNAELLELGRAAGLKLHRFKRTSVLPRVKAVLGVLRGIAPADLLDIGTGRGAFLWPLLDAFPGLMVTVVERDQSRHRYLDAVHRGGITPLRVMAADACALPLEDRAFDVVTALEVLEHQQDPAPMAREAVRLASRFVIASVPSKPDNNPEHLQLFSEDSLTALLKNAGAARVQITYVLNHIIAVASVGPAT
jgi:ubiquinone/menaquinone biosynthesis C-methylase UbiE